MKSENKKRLEAIYVELDALLDTRLATIALIDEDLAVKTLETGYHQRIVDEFDNVDMDQYRTLYTQRDGRTLSKSMCTGVIELVRHLVGVLTEQAIARPFHEGAKVVINTFPYNLSTEVSDEIGKAIAAWMQGLAPTETVYIQPESLTPTYCKDHFAMMIVYDHESWMNLHAKAFEQTRLPEVTMFAPALFGTRMTQDELEKITREAAHPVRALEMLASPIINLRLIDVKHFSVIAK